MEISIIQRRAGTYNKVTLEQLGDGVVVQGLGVGHVGAVLLFATVADTDGHVARAIVVRSRTAALEFLDQVDGVVVGRRALASSGSGTQEREEGKKSLGGKHCERFEDSEGDEMLVDVD